MKSYTDFRGQRKNRGGKSPTCLANLSVKQLSKTNFIFLQQIKIIRNEAAVTHMQSRGIWQEFSIFSKDEIRGQLWVLGIENDIP